MQWVWLGGCGLVGVVGWVWLGGCGCQADLNASLV